MKKWIALIALAALLVCVLAPGVSFTEDRDTVLLARALYALAHDDSYDAKLALGTVVMNRLDDAWFADTLGAMFPGRTNGLANAGTRWREEMEKLSHAESAENAERVLVVVSHAPGRFGAAFAAGEGTYLDEILRAAGFSNALAGVTGYPSLDPDRIAALAPDLLIDIHPDGDPPEEDAWSYLKGVRVQVLRDTAALRPGPRLPEVLSRFRSLAR